MTLSTVDRYDPERVTRVGDRAVVVGGSVAGLCAARVLDDAFAEVVVLERDRLAEKPTAREGASQTHHPHALLEAGRVVLEDLLPGFGEKLRAAGGLEIDAATEMAYYAAGGYVADGTDPLPMYCASRPLFEHVIRQSVTARDDVELHDTTQFLTYQVGRGGSDVTGVRYRDEHGTIEILDADLVVDATGRASRTPTWLADQGYEPPAVDEVRVDVTYATIRVKRPPDDRRLYVVPPEPPRTRGGVAMPVENGRWEVILQGLHGDDAPANREAFQSFAESLPVAAIAAITREQQWVSEGIRRYPFPSSVRRTYEDLKRFPAGLLVTGDAVASFNPVYGQGMSVAALDALALHHALAEEGDDHLAAAFFSRVGEIVDTAWALAVGSDFEFPQTTGPKPRGAGLFNRYVSRLLRRAHADGNLTDAFYRVIRLEHPPTSLLRPEILWRVFRPSLGGSA